jgi:hypothetical protein
VGLTDEERFGHLAAAPETPGFSMTPLTIASKAAKTVELISVES